MPVGTLSLHREIIIAFSNGYSVSQYDDVYVYDVQPRAV